MKPSEPTNQEQKEFWNDLKGQIWVEMQPRIDGMLAPFDEQTMQTLELRSGERVLEIGSGTGTSSLGLLQRIGPSGSLLAVDLSRIMLNRAVERAEDAGASNAKFVEADAQLHDFPAGFFDAAYSRFGIMFFEDPVTAFRNIRSALKPGARLAFVCWADRQENSWISYPARVARQFLELPDAPPEGAPGMFSMEKEGRIRDILQDAGWSGISVEVFETENLIGSDVEDAADFISKMGPMSEPFAKAEPLLQEKTLAALKEALQPYEASDGVRMKFCNWIVSAVSS